MNAASGKATFPQALSAAFVGMADYAGKLRDVLKLIKADVKPGSKWYPVSSSWLRRAQVHAGLEEAHVDDTREAPGKLDNSDVADPIFPMCIRRSAVRACIVAVPALRAAGHCAEAVAKAPVLKIPKTRSGHSGLVVAAQSRRTTRTGSSNCVGGTFAACL